MSDCPGTLQLCTTCACHREHYGGGKYGKEAQLDDKGWFYCDRYVEAFEIKPPTEDSCHWYTRGRDTHRTPLPGVRQALWLGWTPGPVNSPKSKPSAQWQAKAKLIAEIKKLYGLPNGTA